MARVGEIVSHHFLRRTARARALELADRGTGTFRVERAGRIRYRWVVRRIK